MPYPKSITTVSLSDFVKSPSEKCYVIRDDLTLHRVVSVTMNCRGKATLLLASNGTEIPAEVDGAVNLLQLP